MTIRARLLRLAQRLSGASNVSQIMIYDRDGTVICMSFPARADTSGQDPELLLTLREVEKNLLEAATHEPQDGDEMARAAGYAEGSYPRSMLAGLVKRGLLVKVHGGYQLPPKA